MIQGKKKPPEPVVHEIVVERTPKLSKEKVYKEVQAVQIVHEKVVVVEKQNSNIFAVIGAGAE